MVEVEVEVVVVVVVEVVDFSIVLLIFFLLLNFFLVRHRMFDCLDAFGYSWEDIYFRYYMDLNR